MDRDTFKITALAPFDDLDDSREAITSGEKIGIDINESELCEYSLTVPAIDHDILRIEEVSIINKNIRYGDRIEVRDLGDGKHVLVKLTEPSDFKTEVYILSEKTSISTLVRGLLNKIAAAGGSWEIIFGGVLTTTGPKEILDGYLPKLSGCGDK